MRGHSERLGEEDVKLRRSKRTELSEDEAQMLSDKLSQVRKGMTITAIYLSPDEDDGDIGYYMTVTGTVTNIDTDYKVLKIDTGNVSKKDSVDMVIKSDYLLDICGNEIYNIDKNAL